MKRFCEINDIEEVANLKRGIDFRQPQYRREVFLRFYEFHLKYGAHAGAVYYAFPYIFGYLGMNLEQRLWFSFINGCSQHVLTTFRLFNKFPDFRTLDVAALDKYFKANYTKFGWDTDRRYHKKCFIECVENYRALVAPFGSQEEYFYSKMLPIDRFKNFDALWKEVSGEFYGFGRLASFSYLEYLRLAGLPIDCSNLFLSDINGSKSHRNGICKVLGRDDKDWHDKINPNFNGVYTDEEIRGLTIEAEKLISESKERFEHNDISYFTLETTLCCYKSWHRPNRRYPNVYNDMFAERIRKDEAAWNESNSLFWEMRQSALPVNLRIEDNPADVGLKPLKQNWYRETGQVIMMNEDWSCFKNDYNDFVNSQQKAK